nr:MAG TPA: hypothetical protein [Bacteriophage sp.]
MGSIYKVIIYNCLTHISFIYGLAKGETFRIPPLTPNLIKNHNNYESTAG